MYYRFGEYTLAPERFELKRKDAIVPVEPQVLQVLSMLIANRDRVVLKDEILEHVWGSAYVGESTLSSRVMAARKAIGDSGSSQDWIKTIHGRGFRFVGHVVESAEFVGEAGEVRCLLDAAKSEIDSNRLDLAANSLRHAHTILASAGFELDKEYADWHRLQAQMLLLNEGWSSESARTHYLESIRLAEGVGAVEIFRSARYDLATMLEVRGDFKASATLMSAAIADTECEGIDAEAHELLACSLFHQGMFSASAAQAKRGVEASGRSAERRLSAFYGEDAEVSCLHWLAICTWILGDEAEAIRLSNRAIRVSEQPGMIFCLAHSRQQSALFNQLRGDLSQTAHWAQALVWIGTRQNLPYRTAFGEVLLNWAVCQEQPDTDRVSVMEASIDNVSRIGAHMELPYLRALLAETLVASDEPSRAADLLDQSIAVTVDRPGYFYLSEMYRTRALAGARAGESEQVTLEWFARAEETANAQGALAFLSRIRARD